MHARKFFFKNRIFRFVKKWSRMHVNIKYWLEMCFEHFGGLFWTISEHLWWPDSPLKKFDFLKKMHFCDFFGFLILVVLDTKKHQKCQIFENFLHMHCLCLEDACRYLRCHLMVCRYDLNVVILRRAPIKTFWFFAKILLQTSRMKTLRVSTRIYRSRRTNL